MWTSGAGPPSAADVPWSSALTSTEPVDPRRGEDGSRHRPGDGIVDGGDVDDDGLAPRPDRHRATDPGRPRRCRRQRRPGRRSAWCRRAACPAASAIVRITGSRRRPRPSTRRRSGEAAGAAGRPGGGRRRHGGRRQGVGAARVAPPGRPAGRERGRGRRLGEERGEDGGDRLGLGPERGSAPELACGVDEVDVGRVGHRVAVRRARLDLRVLHAPRVGVRRTSAGVPVSPVYAGGK